MRGGRLSLLSGRPSREVPWIPLEYSLELAFDQRSAAVSGLLLSALVERLAPPPVEHRAPRCVVRRPRHADEPASQASRTDRETGLSSPDRVREAVSRSPGSCGRRLIWHRRRLLVHVEELMGRRSGLLRGVVAFSQAARALDRAARTSRCANRQPRASGGRPAVGGTPARSARYRFSVGERVIVDGAAGTVGWSIGAESFVLWDHEPGDPLSGAWFLSTDLTVIGLTTDPDPGEQEPSWSPLDPSRAHAGDAIQVIASRMPALVGMTGTLHRVVGGSVSVRFDVPVETSPLLRTTNYVWLSVTDLLTKRLRRVPLFPGARTTLVTPADRSVRRRRVLVLAATDQWAVISTGAAGHRQVMTVPRAALPW